jgi:predicted nuclease of predicted toxin-antitoxin system
MKLHDFGLLTDENVEIDVVQWLRQTGFDVFDACEQGLQGWADRDILRLAVAGNRVIVTDDADYGMLAILQGEPVMAYSIYDLATSILNSPLARYKLCSTWILI